MTVEATHARTSAPPAANAPDSNLAAEPASARPARATQSSLSPLLSAGDARRDESVRRFVETRREPGAPRLGNGVLYVGMNSMHSQCDREAALLAQTGPGVRRSIGHAERDPKLGSDHVRLAASAGPSVDAPRIVDLGTADGARAFAATLGLSEESASAVAGILLAALPGSRDELGAIALVFARGERGEDVPSRLVLSGHCTGDSVYDGSGVLGTLRFADVFALATAMPRAAAQIEDVMLSACNSGHERPEVGVAIGAWRDSFPNLKTVWAYAGTDDAHSPTGDVALKHIEAWELATRGRQEHVNARRAIHGVGDGRGVGYEASVSVWSAREGYVQGAPTRKSARTP